MSGSDVLVVTSRLCETVANKFPVNNECSTLPAPVIAPPFVGNRFVEVLSAVPGASIATYDGSGNELGDSAGIVISLNREIQPGDVLNAVQRVGDCLSNSAYRISAMCTNEDQGCG